MYCRASAHAGENVGRVAPLPGVAVHRAIASMSARILSTEIGMIYFCIDSMCFAISASLTSRTCVEIHQMLPLLSLTPPERSP
jgi:hypothetical protein